MYRYDEFDTRFVHQRAAQFRDQLERHLAGQLPDDDFRALRLQNGWYVQRHAPMARIAVPYGELSSKQLRALARVAREFDGLADGNGGVAPATLGLGVLAQPASASAPRPPPAASSPRSNARRSAATGASPRPAGAISLCRIRIRT